MLGPVRFSSRSSSAPLKQKLLVAKASNQKLNRGNLTISKGGPIVFRFNFVFAVAIAIAGQVASAGPLSTIGITRGGKVITRPAANVDLSNLPDELLESRGTVVEPP